MDELMNLAPDSSCDVHTEDDFEGLALGHLTPTVELQLEFHAATCLQCQEREFAAIEYVAMIRESLQRLLAEDRNQPWGEPREACAERRASPRRPCDRPVVIQITAAAQELRQMKAYLRDVSDGGFGIIAHEGLAPNAQVRITDGKGSWMAEVRRCCQGSGLYVIGLQLIPADACAA
jgi:hypothetical protein